MLWRNIPAIHFAAHHGREPCGTTNVGTGLFCQHYGKSLSIEHWEETCDYYIKHFPFDTYGRKWTERKGKAVHTESDFGRPLYEWGERLFANAVKLEALAARFVAAASVQGSHSGAGMSGAASCGAISTWSCGAASASCPRQLSTFIPAFTPADLARGSGSTSMQPFPLIAAQRGDACQPGAAIWPAVSPGGGEDGGAG